MARRRNQDADLGPAVRRWQSEHRNPASIRGVLGCIAAVRLEDARQQCSLKRREYLPDCGVLTAIGGQRDQDRRLDSCGAPCLDAVTYFGRWAEQCAIREPAVR